MALLIIDACAKYYDETVETRLPKASRHGMPFRNDASAAALSCHYGDEL